MLICYWLLSSKEHNRVRKKSFTISLAAYYLNYLSRWYATNEESRFAVYSAPCWKVTLGTTEHQVGEPENG